MNAVLQTNILRFQGNEIADDNDYISSEEPLEIRIRYGSTDQLLEKSISITMRTPGNDPELALGFLYSEGLIGSYSDIEDVEQSLFGENHILVSIKPEIKFEILKLERHFYTSSSCGVCGKTSIDAVHAVIPAYDSPDIHWDISPELIYSLPEKLRAMQSMFEATGGLHASALFDKNGELLILKEDVGRHNALDKVIGQALQQNLLPLNKHILLLSGRASFELIQKAAMAGIKMVLAVGAPSGLAVELAESSGITLVGFLRDRRFNLYSQFHRIQINETIL